MIFNSGNIEKLKEKERILQKKEEPKHSRSKITNKEMYNQITEAITPYLMNDKLKIVAYP